VHAPREAFCHTVCVASLLCLAHGAGCDPA
jgi:hypothetical protein